MAAGLVRMALEEYTYLVDSVSGKALFHFSIISMSLIKFIKFFISLTCLASFSQIT